MRDMTNAEVTIGDLLIDERGRVYEVRETPPMLQREQCIYVYNVSVQRGRAVRGEEGFLRRGACLKVPTAYLTLAQGFLRTAWQIAFERYRAPEIDKEIAEHRAAVNRARARRGIAIT